MARKTKTEADQTRQDILTSARKVFLEHGVRAASLDMIAKTAGVTRGAVYWHFANKIDLFFALREEIKLPFIDRVDDKLLGGNSDDALASIEEGLHEMIRTLEQDEVVRDFFDIVFFRCEYIHELASVLEEFHAGCSDFVSKLTSGYRLAMQQGLVRSGLQADQLAWESHMFVAGILRHWVGDRQSIRIRPIAHQLISSHIQTRRISPDTIK